MSKHLSRRNFLKLAVGSAGAAALASCAAPAAPEVVEVEKQVVVTQQVEVVKEVLVTAVAPEPVTIRFTEGSWVGPEGISFWAEEVVGRFELENPGITVEFESAETGGYFDKLLTQLVAGVAPDVMFVYGSLNYDLMKKGLLLPVDEYFQADYLEDFNPGNLLMSQYEGHLYGLPKECQSHALAYNKDILDEAGVDYPDGTWDWDDYLAACQATTKRDDSGEIVQWGAYLLHNYLFHWVWMNGGEWMNAPSYATECLLDGEKAMEALQFKYDMMWGQNPVAPLPGTIPDAGWSNVFLTGKVALVETCSWQVTRYVRGADFRWDFADLVTARDGTKSSPTYSSQRSVSKGTKHPAEAVGLLEFMSSPWTQKQACVGIIGALPGRRSIWEDWDLNSLAAQFGYDAAAFTRIQPFVGPRPWFRDPQDVNDIYGPIWDQIWVTGELGLEEGIMLLVDRIDEYYA